MVNARMRRLYDQGERGERGRGPVAGLPGDQAVDEAARSKKNILINRYAKALTLLSLVVLSTFVTEATVFEP